MKKVLNILILFCFVALLTKAQQPVNIQLHHNHKPQKDLSQTFKKPSIQTRKAIGDTLYYQDFDGGLPTGWTIFNSNNFSNNFQWTWDTVYNNGQFTLPSDVITSTTASNGFMSLTADFYNTPIPPTGAVAMDTYFESDSISITPNCAVWVSYQQTVAYCCSGANRLVLQISTDNFVTFQEFDATDGIAVNERSGTYINTVNVNSALTNASSFKIRFLSEGNSHYFWMIDDFAVIEGPKNDMALVSQAVGFNPTYSFNPFYFQIPADFLTSLNVTSTILNNGCNPATNANFRTTIIHDSFPNGTPGIGLINTLNSTSTPSLPLSATITATTPSSSNLIQLGSYTVQTIALSDSVDQFPGNETAVQRFSTSDSVLAKDNGVFSLNDRTGPQYFISGGIFGGVVNDKFGTRMIIESQSGSGGAAKIPTSLSLRVYLDSSYGAVEIIPQIWPISLTGISLTIQPPIASSFVPYVISTSSVIDTFINLPFDMGSATISGLPDGEYVVGYTIVNDSLTQQLFDVLDNVSGLASQPPVSCLLNINGTQNWSWVNANPGIRLNFGNLPITTALDDPSLDSNSSIGVIPNPNSGEFEILYEGKSNESQLRVINTLGQSVFQEKLTAHGKARKRMNLDFLESGLYYIIIENELERLVEMVVIN